MNCSIHVRDTDAIFGGRALLSCAIESAFADASCGITGPAFLGACSDTVDDHLAVNGCQDAYIHFAACATFVVIIIPPQTAATAMIVLLVNIFQSLCSSHRGAVFICRSGIGKGSIGPLVRNGSAFPRQRDVASNYVSCRVCRPAARGAGPLSRLFPCSPHQSSKRVTAIRILRNRGHPANDIET
jgi:hypothetical protein